MGPNITYRTLQTGLLSRQAVTQTEPNITYLADKAKYYLPSRQAVMQTGLNRIWSQATFCTTTRMPRPGSARSRKLYLHSISAATSEGRGGPSQEKAVVPVPVPYRQSSGTKFSESGSGSLRGLLLNLSDLYFRLS
jgi:hypothetical protein